MDGVWGLALRTSPLVLPQPCCQCWETRSGVTGPPTESLIYARRASCHPPLCLQQGQPPKQVSGSSSVSLSHSLLTDRPVCGEPLPIPSRQDFHTCELIFFFSFTVSWPYFKLSKTLWRAVSQYIILLVLFYAYECFSCMHICAVCVWHPWSLKVSGGCKSPCEPKPTSTKATSFFTAESSLQPNR